MRFHVVTEHPVALDSPDHWHPVGTKNDNTVNRAFNRKLYELIPAHDVRLLDIGCAGGGLVKSILDDGGIAVGIEGSDYSKARRRAEWATIPDNLFTADATRRFEVQGDGWPYFRFNVVTAWDVWEHFAEDDIPAVCDNILRHLDHGFFVGSIAEFPDVQEGVVTPVHRTLRPKGWWLAKLDECGLVHAPDIEAHFEGAMLRWSSFYVALRHK